MAKQYYSFDIFDTCLVRLCGRPELVFDLLAKRLMPDASESMQYDFVLERIRGEKMARERILTKDKEEVSISEIYSCCNFGDLELPPLKKIIEEELDAERSVLSRVQSVLEEIEKLRNEGKQILFVSDMYLPYNFIKELLEKHGFYKHGDILYLSCEVGKSKLTGNLYRHIQKELNIDYHSWTHRGDNIYSDKIIPKSLGIKVKEINHSYSFYENLMRSTDNTSSIFCGSLMAGISRAVRLRRTEDAYSKFAADLIAPVFVPFVYSVLVDAKERGIHSLYFLARDAYIFYKIAQQFEDIFPEIKLCYLYVSRNSLYLPGLKEVSLETIRGLFTKIDYCGLDDVLERLHMRGYKVREEVREIRDTKELLNALLADNGFKESLIRVWKEQKALCCQYFEQEGVGNGETAIVDLTGTRRCQMSINTILREKGKNQVFGYYLEVLDKRIVGQGYKAYNFAERYAYTNYKYCIAHHDLYEQYFCITNHKRTAAYEKVGNEVRPCFEEDLQDSAYKQKVCGINIAVCEDYAKAYKLLLKDVDHQKCMNTAISVVSDFFYSPKKDYLTPLKDCVLSDSSVSGNRLLKKRSIIYLLRNREKSPWLYGNIVFSSRFPRIWEQILRWRIKRKSNW